MKKSSVLIVIKSGKYLEKLFDSITKLDYPKDKLEFIFLDNNCDSNTSKILCDLTKGNSYLKSIKTKKDLNIPQARNLLLKYSKGEIIVFTDHDVILEPKWLKKIDKRIEEGYEIIGGRMDSRQEKILPKIENIRKNIYYDYAEKHKIFHFETANIAFKRSVIKKLCFDNKAKFAEDLDFTTRAKKLGFKLKFDKDIYVYHHHRENLIGYLKTIFKYGVSHAYVDKKEKVVGLKKKVKILWYLLFPFILIFFFLFFNYGGLFLFALLLINKYTIPAIKKGIIDKKVGTFLVLFLEPLRFLIWSYGFIWGIIKNEP
jgi:cellulose synthase/poly-beta-1,6-N-acetylglucosamine synthase-like glycosyltransferase